MLLLQSGLLALAMGDERIRDLAEGLLDGPLIDDGGFLLLCFRELDAIAESPSLENGLCRMRAQCP